MKRAANRSPVPMNVALSLGINSLTNCRFPLVRLLAMATNSLSFWDNSLLDMTTVGMPLEWSESIARIASESFFIVIPVNSLIEKKIIFNENSVELVVLRVNLLSFKLVWCDNVCHWYYFITVNW